MKDNHGKRKKQTDTDTEREMSAQDSKRIDR